MRITINLATRPFADLGPILQRLRIAMAVFAVVSMGLGFGLYKLHTKAEAARARDHSLDGQITKISQERQGYEAMMRQPDNSKILNEANALNQLFDEKAFSWTLAMEDLETVLPAGVQVTTLEPVRDDKTGRITLRLRVTGPRDKNVELVQNLEHSHHFLHPIITGESSEANAGPGQPLEPVGPSNKVNFDLNAEFNPATLGDHPPAPKKDEEGAKKVDASLTTKASATGVATLPNQTGFSGAAGAGLRRPTYSGVAQPPAALGQPKPLASARPAPANPMNPAAMANPYAARQARMHRYPTPQQTQPATTPRPGGPQ